MIRQVFFPNPDSKPSGCSPAIRVGNTVSVSGQVVLDDSGWLVGPGDCGAQVEQCLRNVGTAFEATGESWDEVVKMTTFLVNVSDYDAYAGACHKMFPENGPASSTVIIAPLVKPEFLIEIEAVAMLDGSSGSA